MLLSVKLERQYIYNITKIPTITVCKRQNQKSMLNTNDLHLHITAHAREKENSDFQLCLVKKKPNINMIQNCHHPFCTSSGNATSLEAPWDTGVKRRLAPPRLASLMPLLLFCVDLEPLGGNPQVATISSAEMETLFVQIQTEVTVESCPAVSISKFYN